MASSAGDQRAAIPSVDALLGDRAIAPLIDRYGRPAVTDAVREVLAEIRMGAASRVEPPAVASAVAAQLAQRHAVTPRPVFNLTGTVLHTNLGRALLPEAAIEALATVARQPANVEFDLERGRRGDRDSHLEAWLARLTGAEAATVVNNNAAALLLVLNTLALRRQVPVSRGELIEIGGSFRLPEIMTRAGCKLVEVGTTNRTHPRDYAEAITARSALLMRVHRSNFAVTGFTRSVDDRALAGIAHDHGLPLLNDLGSGTLVDLRRYGLPAEPTAAGAIAAGADLVTFSGDKLLGGPQCGIVVGRAELVKRLKRNPLKRALRVDKLTLAALGAVLALYDDPDTLAERLPTLRLLTRGRDELRALATRLAPALQAAVADQATVEVIDCDSEIGSGALPTATLPSAGLAIVPHQPGRRGERVLRRLAERLRELPLPVIGRVHGGRLLLDLRCLEDDRAFTAQLVRLAP